tara:strand:- start:7 stop:216 length:210 start_codon:yes stop_codon:yes gene_type:complete
MGVKSTVELSREEAEARLVDSLIEQRANEMKRILAAHVAQMGDTELEDQLMELNDERAGGEGFENYDIV